MALEFQLGADIVATTVNPSFQSLGELAILAATAPPDSENWRLKRA